MSPERPSGRSDDLTKRPQWRRNGLFAVRRRQRGSLPHTRGNPFAYAANNPVTWADHSGYAEEKAQPVPLAAQTGARGGAVRSPVREGEAGSYGDLKSRSVRHDQLVPHHMPQKKMGFTSEKDGGALIMREGEHAFTRTFKGRGRVVAQSEAGLPFRDVLARDIRDVRSIVGGKYNQGLRDLLDYYRQNFPALIAK